MQRIALAAIAAALSACTPAEPPIAGKMTERDICQTAGYLIRQKLGNNINTVDVPCSVSVTAGSEVRIQAGYKTPLNSTHYYTATGSVSGDTLRIREIRDEDGSVDFRNWP